MGDQTQGGDAFRGIGRDPCHHIALVAHTYIRSPHLLQLFCQETGQSELFFCAGELLHFIGGLGIIRNITQKTIDY